MKSWWALKILGRYTRHCYYTLLGILSDHTADLHPPCFFAGWSKHSVFSLRKAAAKMHCFCGRRGA